MNILILEDNIQIKDKYLEYLLNHNTLYRLWDLFIDDSIDVIMLRSNIIIDLNLLNKFRNIKYVARVWVWLEKIDLELCNDRWIEVINTPFANSDSVADLVLAWILNLSRKLYLDCINIDNRFNYMWRELNNSTVWIIWFWNIWKKVYNRLLWFWVTSFLIYDPFITEENINKYKYCKKIENKNEIFSNSNILTFHIPLLDSTKNFLWEEWISKLKKDVNIINTSRWGIIDENSLIKFLWENKNSWLFIDVWEEEPNEPKIWLQKLDNVIITPHIWAMTQQAEEKMHFFKELI